MFFQVLFKVNEQDAVYRAFHTGKTDFDAVFNSQRLRVHLGCTIEDYSPHGLYLVDWPNVQYCFSVHLEVIFGEGARVLT